MIDSVLFRTSKFGIRQEIAYTWTTVKKKQDGHKVSCSEVAIPEEGRKECMTLPRVFFSPGCTSADGKRREQALSVQVSIPKFLFGNSLMEISDEDRDVFAEKMVAVLKTAGIIVASENVLNARVGKIDYCKNIPLPQDFGDATEEIGRLSLFDYKPWCKGQRVTYESQDGITVNLGNKSNILRIYAKIPEMESGSSVVGIPDRIVRIEHSLLNTKVIRSTLKRIVGEDIQPSLLLKDLWNEEIGKAILKDTIMKSYGSGLNGAAYRILRDDTFDPIDAITRLECSNGMKWLVSLFLRSIERQGVKEAFLSAKKKYGSAKAYRLKKLVENLPISPFERKYLSDIVAFMLDSLSSFNLIRCTDLKSILGSACPTTRWIKRGSLNPSP